MKFMRINNIISYTVAVLLITIVNSNAEILLLNEYLIGTIKNHPAAQLDLAGYQKSLKVLIANESIKDWTLFANTSYQKGLSGFGGSYNKGTNQTQINLGLNKIMTNTGTRVNVNLSQSNKLNSIFPFLQVPNENGNWITVVDNMGFPKGKNKTMIIDLTDKFITKQHL